MTDYYDDLENRDPAEREAVLMAALPQQIAHAKSTDGNSKLLRDIDPQTVTSRAALAQLPVMRKNELIKLQADNPPFGGLNATPTGQLSRLFLSPGPIAEPEGQKADFWRMGRALFAAGFRAGDIIQNCFSYHMTPAGFLFDAAARAVGCAVIPAGIGQTEQQCQMIAHFKPVGYAGTPDFLKIILGKADELNVDASSITKASVGGGALLPPLRKEYTDRGIQVLQSYGTADVGNIAYESEAQEGMIVEEEIILEIVRPGTGDLVAEGEVGEVVVTLLNKDYPLVRFGTGDLSAILPGISPCGRTAPRIKGWMGRADQRTKVRGMFVDPVQIDRVLKVYDDITRMRLVVGEEGGLDKVTLKCEAAAWDDALAEKVATSFQAECKVRATIEFAENLPKDGKIIDDERKYD
ncbi:MAG: AMP-dependent synthetase [Rhodospirillaceae bacterium]|nr:AMP-dependent synthetase [Rhodospirillaceae bacterium]|tara:strand:+ start:323 stop:1549 length:1227 start_codon:yes stop_codon:yes gene_type:complete